MSRRPLMLLALALTSLVASACSDISAPSQDDVECRSGYIQGGARNCEQ